MPHRTQLHAHGPTLVEPTWTVTEIVARYPATAAVFTRFGIDSCCGGGVPMAAAARREGLDPDAVLAAVHDAIHQAPASA